jgi:3-dehydroquinate synthase
MKTTIQVSGEEKCILYAGDESFGDLKDWLSGCGTDPGDIFILVDSNTEKHCLPVLLQNVSLLQKAALIRIPAGESHKTLETAMTVIDRMSSCHAGRRSLLINLGGGVVSDLGGFVASIYQRGIPYINIPTTLMAQADAAIGGKTAVNTRHLKNQAGTFRLPAAVFIRNGFLETLDKTHIKNGFAEIIKCGLACDEGLWSRIRHLVPGTLDEVLPILPLAGLIERSAGIKCHIVQEDYLEKDLRRILNFGHTAGHALETLSLEKGEELLHGHAVALGMISEAWLSSKVCGLPEEDLENIVSFLLRCFEHYPIDLPEIKKITGFMMHDKKNTGNGINFTMIKKPGQGIAGQCCEPALVEESLHFYRQIRDPKASHKDNNR